MLELLYEFRADFAHGVSSRNAFHFAAAAPVSPSSFKALEFLVPDSQSKHASASPSFCSARGGPCPGQKSHSKTKGD